MLSRDGLLAAEAASSPHPLAPQPPHFAPRAKAVIQIFCPGVYQGTVLETAAAKAPFADLFPAQPVPANAEREGRDFLQSSTRSTPRRAP